MTTHEPDEQEQFAPVPVQIGGSVHVEGGRLQIAEEAAAFGAYTTITIPATTFSQQVLWYDKDRARAYLTCSGTGPVWVGSAAQCQANPPLGYQLASGATLPVMHKQPLWVAGAGATAQLSVAIERWDG